MCRSPLDDPMDSGPNTTRTAPHGRQYNCTLSMGSGTNRFNRVRRTHIPSHRVRRSWLVLCLLLVAIPVLAQTTQDTKPPFQPQVGQHGKDVVWVPTPQTLVDKMLDMAKMTPQDLSLIHISEPTRLGMISYAVFCLK